VWDSSQFSNIRCETTKQYFIILSLLLQLLLLKQLTHRDRFIVAKPRDYQNVQSPVINMSKLSQPTFHMYKCTLTRQQYEQTVSAYISYVQMYNPLSSTWANCLILHFISMTGDCTFWSSRGFATINPSLCVNFFNRTKFLTPVELL
jgi:hypothetical protein